MCLRNFVVVVFGFVCMGPVLGMTILPRPWQAEVFNADFVGVIRCIKPGGD